MPSEAEKHIAIYTIEDEGDRLHLTICGHRFPSFPIDSPEANALLRFDAALSAASAVRSEGVKVRALEWIEPLGHGDTLTKAITILGTYRVWTYHGAGSWFWQREGENDHATLSRENGKSAAEKDYQNRILSAITSPVQTREDGIREAAKIAAERWRELDAQLAGGKILEHLQERVTGRAFEAQTLEASILALLSQPEPRGDKA